MHLIAPDMYLATLTDYTTFVEHSQMPYATFVNPDRVMAMLPASMLPPYVDALNAFLINQAILHAKTVVLDPIHMQVLLTDPEIVSPPERRTFPFGATVFQFPKPVVETEVFSGKLNKDRPNVVKNDAIAGVLVALPESSTFVNVAALYISGMVQRVVLELDSADRVIPRITPADPDLDIRRDRQILANWAVRLIQLAEQLGLSYHKVDQKINLKRHKKGKRPIREYCTLGDTRKPAEASQ